MKERRLPIYLKRITSIMQIYLETPLLVPSMLCRE